MKTNIVAKIVALLLVLTGAAFAVWGFLPPRQAGGYDVAAFARIPVQYGTRVLPIDSVARNTLRMISGRTELTVPSPGDPTMTVELPALQWFLDVAFRPEVAARVPVFRIDNDEVLGLVGQTQKGTQRFSFADLSPHFDDIQTAADAADKKRQDDEKLSLFEDEVSRLRGNLELFQQMTMSFVPPGDTPAKDLALWQSSLKAGSQTVLDKDAGKPVDQNLLDSFSLQAKMYLNLQTDAIVGLIPPAGSVDDKWANLGVGALTALKTGEVSPILIHYGEIGEALRTENAPAFNTAVAALQAELNSPALSTKPHFEAFLNRVAPFYRGSVLYVLAFLCACVSWLAWGEELRRAALALIGIGFALQLLGLVARVYLTGYWVVTSLYSSALFVGFMGVLAGLVIEFFFKRGIGAAVASAIGFITLVIAQNLPLGDDPDLLARPRAVLATNLWLSTHVTCITIGYSAMFVAGLIATYYIFYRLFTAQPSRELTGLFTRLVYGVTCFATLFSFVGTMLGGIWADQSWGRFWGWDPKENGALLIVLWCAICLHARWGKLCGVRGQMALAVGGNVVTAWSWFGVNLLSVGLHSYGFVAGTFYLLSLYVGSQIVLIGLAFLPPRFWKAAQPAPAG